MHVYTSFSEIHTVPQDSVFACPTDTVYGLSCRVDDMAGVDRIRALKQRPHDMPLIVALGSWEQIEMFIDTRDPAYRTLCERVLEKVWPGPVSVVCRQVRSGWEHLSHGGTLALRMPARTDFREFLSRVGPLVSTSANLHGQPPATTRDEVAGYFGDALDFVIDTGVCAGAPSSIIKIVR